MIRHYTAMGLQLLGLIVTGEGLLLYFGQMGPLMETAAIGAGWTPAVKALVIACGVAFLLQIFDRLAGSRGAFETEFGLVPGLVTQNYYLWQLVTYIFLHGGFFHILFNMFGLYMFGSELELTWGTKEFTKFFFICG